MSSALPPSPLGAPDLRRQLQQRYEEAQRLAAQPAPDHQRIHDLLAECLRADPGSILYLDALLANLRRWGPKRRWLDSWRKRWQKAFGNVSSRQVIDETTLRTQYSVLSTEYGLLQTAPERLLSRPGDPYLYRELAAAAGACDLGEVELRYRELAAASGPADVGAQLELARTLTRQGRFDAAAYAWEQLLVAAPADAEAQQALADLDPATARQFDVAERALADAQAAGGATLSILTEREALQLDRALQRLNASQRRAASDPHPKAKQLVTRLQAEHDRLQIEIVNLRCERLPGDWRLRVELARFLKRAGNYSGAIQRLDEAAKLAPQAAAIWIELGECWQHLRQFAKALNFYEQAIPLAAGDERQLAQKRATVLSAAMNQTNDAR